MKTSEIKGKMLSVEQAMVVKEMIIDSMRNVYINEGSKPSNGFASAADIVSDGIVKKVQMALLQSSTFAKIANKPAKTVKKASKKINKTKRNVRK